MEKSPFLPYKALIKDIRQETDDIRTYTVSLNHDGLDFRPGQFNMLGWPGVGEAPISLSAIHSKKDTFEHTIRAVGRVTRFFERLSKGDEIFLRGPYGSAWPMDEARGKDLIIVAGGLGMAPLKPVVHAVLKEREAFGKVTLIYGAKTPDNIIFINEIKGWTDRISVFLTVDEVPEGMAWEHEVGLVTGPMDKMDIDVSRTLSFICGPEIMMRFASRKLIFNGVSDSKVYVSLERRMKCGIAQCGHCQMGSKFVCKDGPVFKYKDVSRFPDSLL